jgi:hypothetical protein
MIMIRIASLVSMVLVVVVRSFDLDFIHIFIP